MFEPRLVAILEDRFSRVAVHICSIYLLLLSVMFQVCVLPIENVKQVCLMVKC